MQLGRYTDPARVPATELQGEDGNRALSLVSSLISYLEKRSKQLLLELHTGRPAVQSLSSDAVAPLSSLPLPGFNRCLLASVSVSGSLQDQEPSMRKSGNPT